VTVCLLVGYGNTVRGDDGLGPLVVRHFADWAPPPGVELLVEELPQLDLMLIERLARATLAIFVDARHDDQSDALVIQEHHPLDAAQSAGHTSHSVGIDQLLRAARDWYGRAPVCYSVLPKGYEFEFSEALTEQARKSAEAATLAVEAIIDNFEKEESR
jgi:hydrogenase maturation protease